VEAVEAQVIFTLRLLGLEVICIELSQPEVEADDPGCALSGGVVTSYPIQVTQRYGMEPEPWSDYEE
jgi:hypothetical protein